MKQFALVLLFLVIVQLVAGAPQNVTDGKFVKEDTGNLKKLKHEISLMQDDTPSSVPSETAGASPSRAPSETAVASPSSAPSETDEASPSSAPSETDDASPSSAPSETEEASPSSAPSETDEASPSSAPSETEEASPSSAPSETAVASPSSAPSETKEASPSSAPSETDEASPSRAPSETDEASPSSAPSETDAPSPSTLVDCESHSDCFNDEFCNMFGNCQPCADCFTATLWGLWALSNPIDGQCPPCDGCSSHSECYPDSYCDELRNCWSPCVVCYLYNDGIDGFCPCEGCESSTNLYAIAACDFLQGFDSICDDRCRGDDACWCNCWSETADGIGPDGWLDTLPNCPCQLGNGDGCPLSPDPSVWDQPKDERAFHPGSAYCIRSNNMADGGPGQQCCYDLVGKLITEGPGAGTPDLTAPKGPIDAGYHCLQDVQSFEKCNAAGMLDCYLSLRTPNRGSPRNRCGPSGQYIGACRL